MRVAPLWCAEAAEGANQEMPKRIVRPGRIADSQVISLLEDVMLRWQTNHPLMAVGGFSYSRPSEEWLRALEGRDSFVVSSATISEKGAAFTLHFRRARDGVSSDEVTLTWRPGTLPDAPFAEADAAELQGMIEGLIPALPPPALPRG